MSRWWCRRIIKIFLRFLFFLSSNYLKVFLSYQEKKERKTAFIVEISFCREALLQSLINTREMECYAYEETLVSFHNYNTLIFILHRVDILSGTKNVQRMRYLWFFPLTLIDRHVLYWQGESVHSKSNSVRSPCEAEDFFSIRLTEYVLCEDMILLSREREREREKARYDDESLRFFYRLYFC